jgi:hypothetical protein
LLVGHGTESRQHTERKHFLISSDIAAELQVGFSEHLHVTLPCYTLLEAIGATPSQGRSVLRARRSVPAADGLDEANDLVWKIWFFARVSWLGRQANTTRTDQARIGRLKAPEGPANCALEVNVLIIGAAEREVCRCGVAIRDRHEADDETRWIDLHNAAETRRLRPQIAVDVVMDAIRSGISRQIGAALHRTERQMQRILGALGPVMKVPYKTRPLRSLRLDLSRLRQDQADQILLRQSVQHVAIHGYGESSRSLPCQARF